MPSLLREFIEPAFGIFIVSDWFLDCSFALPILSGGAYRANRPLVPMSDDILPKLELTVIRCYLLAPSSLGLLP